jgi:hypothetical protein
MLVNKPRVINCLIQNLQVCLNFPCNLSIPMSGVLHQNMSPERSIALASSMTLVNSPGFISSSSNPRCFRSFKSSKVLLNDSLIKRFLLFNRNWGGEYRKLNSFFTKLGISHHVSCPHAHQQNGVIECKHHHIVEIGLALLSHASMSLKYWDEAFLIPHLLDKSPS